MPKQAQFSNIVWDDEGVDAGLPTSVQLTVDDGHDIDTDNAADLLSDEFGFCVNSFDLDVVDVEAGPKKRAPGMSL